jgi:hypothetical protein
MRFTLPVLASMLWSAVLAFPAVEQRDDVQTVHLTFHAAAAS